MLRSNSLATLISFASVLVVVTSAVDPACPHYPAPVDVPHGDMDKGMASAFAEAEALLETVQRKYNVPGAIAVAVYDQHVIWSKGVGSRNATNQAPPPNLDTVVRIASISKVFTDLMMLKLRDAGIVDLDDTVSQLIPEFTVNNPYRNGGDDGNITLRQLASHTAGLTRESPFPLSNRANETAILQAMAKQFLVLPPSTRFHYSNFGIALLGRALQRVTGVSYEDYIRSAILKPLGMDHSGFFNTDWSRLQGDMAQGFDDGEPITVEDLGWDNPCGGILASAGDVARLIKLMNRRDAHASEGGARARGDGRGARKGDQILDGTTLSEALDPTILLRDGLGAVGMPWESAYNAHTKRYFKSKAGELAGFRSQVSLAPQTKFGVFVAVFSSSLPNAADPSLTAMTQPLLEILVPALDKVLHQAASRSTLRRERSDVGIGMDWFVGTFAAANTSSPRLIVKLSDDGSHRLIGSVAGTTVVYEPLVDERRQVRSSAVDARKVLRIVLDTAAAAHVTCRWLDDGIDQELIYFSDDAANDSTRAMSLLFMQQNLVRIA